MIQEVILQELVLPVPDTFKDEFTDLKFQQGMANSGQFSFLCYKDG
jgi:hypothetical protein